jgi:hypothetical protein
VTKGRDDDDDAIKRDLNVAKDYIDLSDNARVSAMS